MKLRIVAGSLGRRFITLDKQSQDFRPTQERVRQAIAETIKLRIPGAAVVDLCAGSGAFGFEMASRGAASVHFVERDRNRAQSLSKHIELFALTDRCTIFPLDVRTFIRSARGPYDIVFYDPPYGDAGLAVLAGTVPALLSDQGILIYERDVSEVPPPNLFGALEFVRETRTYGDTAVEYVTRMPGL